MADVYWIGGAPAVAQVETASIDSVDGTPANNTFTVTIGTVAISTVGDTDVATTATALRAALNASTHPYFAKITWSGSTGDIIGTADVAGVPFVAALTETGAGTGTVTDFAETTGSSGPHDWSTAANWSGGAIPVNGDTVTIGDTSLNICYGLDQNAVGITDLWIHSSFTGKLGLRHSAFATSVEADTVDTAAPEYRETYLKIDADDVELGFDHSLGGSAASCSTRLKIDNTKSSGASGTFVHKTATTSSESPMPAVRLKFANSAAFLYVKSAAAGVGVTVEPGETSTLGSIWFTPQTATDRFILGRGCTWTNYYQTGGDSVVSGAATATQMLMIGGTCKTEGEWQLTTLNVRGGTIRYNAWHASVPISTLNMFGGTADFIDVGYTRKPTATTLNFNLGTIHMNDEINSFTTINEPDSGNKSITVSVVE